ncbi:hypothetical protein B0H16DRAFT_4139 [Mycena metata]|uniref:Uncharacterized protein n=1 Tax=Mycena metata TaxID=1033252 RepID=A0AAD7P2R3_9AGAR|nr:hypothetical protein B0H16DRAFT_4139 [Mycena metata]
MSFAMTVSPPLPRRRKTSLEAPPRDRSRTLGTAPRTKRARSSPPTQHVGRFPSPSLSFPIPASPPLVLTRPSSPTPEETTFLLPPWLSAGQFGSELVSFVNERCSTDSYMSPEEAVKEYIDCLPTSLALCDHIPSGLLPTLAKVLSTSTVKIIQNSLEALDITSLPKDTIGSQIHQIVDHLVKISRAGEGGAMSDGGDDRGEGGGSSGGGAKGGGGGGGASGGGGSSSSVLAAWRNTRNRFVPTTFTSPSRHNKALNSLGLSIISRAAIRYHDSFVLTSELPPPMDLWSTPTPPAMRTMFHATRRSSLASFKRIGINPPDETQ